MGVMVLSDASARIPCLQTRLTANLSAFSSFFVDIGFLLPIQVVEFNTFITMGIILQLNLLV